MANKYIVVSIRDAKAESYSLPFFQLNKALAMRMFTQLVNDSQSQANRFAEDYALFQVGIFDDATGMFEPMQPLHLANALDVKSDQA